MMTRERPGAANALSKERQIETLRQVVGQLDGVQAVPREYTKWWDSVIEALGIVHNSLMDELIASEKEDGEVETTDRKKRKAA